MTDADHLEIYNERAAIRQYDGGLSQAEAEVKAYYDWRQIVGPGVKAPAEIVEIHRRARKEVER
jgi:hypothetical protein